MEQQRGWTACRRCQGLVNQERFAQACLDGNGVHDTSYGAAYRVPLGQIPDGMQGSWGPCNRCGRLAFRGTPGVCADGAPHSFDDFLPDYGVPVGEDHPESERGWRACGRCQCLCSINNPRHDCFAGGEHDFSSSFAYSVPVVPSGTQEFWAWCERCQSLFRGEGEGICHDGQAHSVSRSDSYSLVYGAVTADLQGDWHACLRCGTLVHASLASGPCYAGGTHDLSGALTYSVFTNDPPHAAQKWRGCSKCGTLSFAGLGPGPCAAGGTHDQSSSAAFSVYPSTVAGRQPGWRKCGKCNSMVFTQLAAGVCRAGGPHDVSTSGWYLVVTSDIFPGMDSSWEWCRRCQTLTHSELVDGAVTNGPCFDHGPHDVVDSALFGVDVEFPPPDAEPGWRRCARCHQLVFAGDGTPGVCLDGAPHDIVADPAMSVVVKPLAAAAPAPSEPTLTITEAEHSVVVDGSAFPSGAAIDLSFVEGPTSVTASVTVDGGGAFHYETGDVVGRAGGAIVLAGTEEGPLASGHLDLFVPAPH